MRVKRRGGTEISSWYVHRSCLLFCSLFDGHDGDCEFILLFQAVPSKNNVPVKSPAFR